MHTNLAANAPSDFSASGPGAPLPPPLTHRGFMVMGVLQGLCLYGLTEWLHWDYMGAGRAWLALWMLLVVQPPLFMAMAVTRWRQPALWMGGAAMALVVLVMGGWSVWLSMHSPAPSEGALLRLGVAISLWWLVALAWFQGYLEQGSWRIPYDRLFVYAWNNALVLALAGLCVQLIWGVLWLWALLLGLLGVTVFADIFSQPWFVYLFSGLAVGLSVWLARTQQRPIQVVRQIMLALGRLLLPLMAWVLVLFVASLVFTGTHTLWGIGFAAGLLMGVVLVHIWLVNAVYQEGGAAQGPYPRWVQHLVHASLLALPVLASLACVAVGLRIGQYGWTAGRLWAAVGSGLLWLYAVGYAVAAFSSWRGTAGTVWLGAISAVNRGMSLVVLAVLLALQTPVLDPERLSARSQLAQLTSGAQAITHARLIDLKFNHGPYGAAALQTLAQHALAQPDDVQAWVAQISDSASRRDVPSVTEDASEWVDVPTAQARIRQAAGPAPDADWWPWLLGQAEAQHWASTCLFESAECVLLSGDWDQDGHTDHLLCDLADASFQRCRLTARAPVAEQGVQPAWQDVGTVEWPYQTTLEGGSRLRDALRTGQVQAKPRWPEWEITIEGEDQVAQPLAGRLQAR